MGELLATMHKETVVHDLGTLKVLNTQKNVDYMFDEGFNEGLLCLFFFFQTFG